MRREGGERGGDMREVTRKKRRDEREERRDEREEEAGNTDA